MAVLLLLLQGRVYVCVHVQYSQVKHPAMNKF